MSARPPARVRLRAYAKINLTLRVLGIRPDGYHDLRTVFQSLALHDVLTLTRTRSAFEIECDEASCPADRTNLIWRAAAELWHACGRRGEPAGVHVRLQKRIPMQAGLGGGSSNAAAALRGLAALWRVGRSEPLLRGIAGRLGADVPFFFEGGTALGVERGDLLFSLSECPASSVVLVVPPFGVPTKAAYSWFDRQGSHGGRPGPNRMPRWHDAPVSASELRNDLQDAVARRHPDIARIASQLERAGAAYAAMSGSGSAVFGVFGHVGRARAAAAALDDRGRRTMVTRTVSRAEFRRLSRAIVSR
jgi:4-diphosphocytidyl-2-C-methyl-D-erythritol kinase